MDLYNLLAGVIVFLLVSAYGCAPLAPGKSDFVTRRNSEIGSQFLPAGLPPPVQTLPLENGKTYYLFLDEETGCRWSYEVDEKTATVEFWQYEGNPNLCR